MNHLFYIAIGLVTIASGCIVIMIIDTVEVVQKAIAYMGMAILWVATCWMAGIAVMEVVKNLQAT